MVDQTCVIKSLSGQRTTSLHITRQEIDEARWALVQRMKSTANRSDSETGAVILYCLTLVEIQLIPHDSSHPQIHHPRRFIKRRLKDSFYSILLMNSIRVPF